MAVLALFSLNDLLVLLCLILILDLSFLYEVLANPELLEDHSQKILRFDIDLLPTLIWTLSNMAGSLLDLIIDDIGELFAEQQALLQIFGFLHVQEIVNSQIYQVVVGDDEQALPVLQGLATLIDRWEQGVVSDQLVLEGHIFGELDLGQHSVYDSHIFIVNSDLTFQVNSSRRSGSVEFHIQFLKFCFSNVANIICCSRNTLAHRLSSS